MIKNGTAQHRHTENIISRLPLYMHKEEKDFGKSSLPDYYFSPECFQMCEKMHTVTSGEGTAAGFSGYNYPSIRGCRGIVYKNILISKQLHLHEVVN